MRFSRCVAAIVTRPEGKRGSAISAIKLVRPPRLISGMIEAKPGQPLGQALEQAQEGLMDDPATSHPFYWAAFIILGDGAKPLVPTTAIAGQAKVSGGR